MAAKKRSVNLPLVQAKVSNLNFKPEKHGDEFQPRADVSLEFLVRDEDVDEFVNVKSNPLKVLWHRDGSPMFRELGDAGIPIGLKAQGTARIGASEEALLEFDTSTMKALASPRRPGIRRSIPCLLPRLGHAAPRRSGQPCCRPPARNRRPDGAHRER